MRIFLSQFQLNFFIQMLFNFLSSIGLSLLCCCPRLRVWDRCFGSLAGLSSWYTVFELPSFLTNLDCNRLRSKSCCQNHRYQLQILYLLDFSHSRGPLCFYRHGIGSFSPNLICLVDHSLILLSWLCCHFLQLIY